MKTKVPYRNDHHWLVASLAEDPSYIEKRMFGCLACYYAGLMVLVLADGETPWNGLLLPTLREHHESLRRDFPEIAPHPVLGKWLYLDSQRSDFEFVAERLVQQILESDLRFGIVPGERKRRKKSSLSKKTKVKNHR